MKSSHFWVVFVLMAAAALELHVRGDVDRVPQSLPLGDLPRTIDGLTAVDIPMDPAVLEVLGKGVFLNRTYNPQPALEGAAANTVSPVGVFIGYFPTQRTGQAIHSPQNCLPGAGWVFEKSGVVDLRASNGKTYNVGEYLISDGKTTDEVLYWYKLHGRSIASDYKAKMYTLADSIRYNRTDAALVRVIAPVLAGEDRAQAHERAVHFAEQLTPLLPAYIPD